MRSCVCLRNRPFLAGVGMRSLAFWTHDGPTKSHKVLGNVLVSVCPRLARSEAISQFVCALQERKPHGQSRGASADVRLTLDPGAQAAFGLRYQAYGVSRRRRRGEIELPRHCHCASSWLGVDLTPKSVPNPPERHENHARNHCALRI